MSARKRVVVHGDVQGVFFRDSTENEAGSRGVAGWVTNRADGAVEAVFEGEAESAGVAGWVANRHDGTVEAVFEGDPDAVERMVSFAREGSRGAEVERVDISDEEPEGLSGFEVR